MEKLVTTQTIKDIDSKSINDFSIHPLILMEHAGVKGFHTCLEHSSRAILPNSNLLFVAGGGNNGGDALVMAREAYLVGMKNIKILFMGDHISSSCNHHRTICQKIGLDMHEISYSDERIDDESEQIISSADIIFDGICGTGLRGKMNDMMAKVISSINKAHDASAYVVSIDIPSGCSDSLSPTMSHIHCDMCITFGFEKSASYHPPSRPSYGKIVKVNPSFPHILLESAPHVALLATREDVVLKKSDSSDYKNKRGHVALFAGSSTYTGAIKIAARSAFHSGAGLVSLFCDKDVANKIQLDTASLIVHAIEKGSTVTKEVLVDTYDAIAVGPGWLRGTQEQMLTLIRSKIALVCDAEGIALFAHLIASKRIGMKEHGPIILTPHPKELIKMLEILHMPLLAQELKGGGTSESFIESLIKIALFLRVVIIYKANVVWIVDGSEENPIPVVVDGSNNALGVAGSGDALTGIVASFLARDYSPLQSAINGVLIHQRAGAMARGDLRWFDVEKLIPYIGRAYKEREETE